MHRPERLTSITSAKLALVSTPARSRVLNDGLLVENTGSALRLYHRVGRPNITHASLVIALTVKFPGLRYSLGGVVAAFEKTKLQAHCSYLRPSSYIIDGLQAVSALLGWQPSMRSLLLASMLVIIATTNCEENVCKGRQVLCRVDQHDGLAKQALQDLLAIRCGPKSAPSRDAVPNNARNGSELYAFDDRSLMRAARLIMDVIHSGRLPRRGLDPDGIVKAFDEALAIEFDRPFLHLRPEIERLASGDLNLGWAAPMTNDQGLDGLLSGAAYAAGN